MGQTCCPFFSPCNKSRLGMSMSMMLRISSMSHCVPLRWNIISFTFSTNVVLCKSSQIKLSNLFIKPWQTPKYGLQGYRYAKDWEMKLRRSRRHRLRPSTVSSNLLWSTFDILTPPKQRPLSKTCSILQLPNIIKPSRTNDFGSKRGRKR